MLPRFPKRYAYFALATLFLISFTYGVRDSVVSLERVFYWNELAREPFDLAEPRTTIISVQPEALAAGIQVGDVLIGVQGRSYTGAVDLHAPLRRARAGGTLSVQVQSTTPGGHNPPLLIRGNEIIHLESGGPVAGLLPAFAYEQATIELRPADLFVAFTDGISEAMNEAEEEWGEDRLIECVLLGRRLSAQNLIEHTINAADRFVAGAKQHDDMTIIIARVFQAVGPRKQRGSDTGFGLSQLYRISVCPKSLNAHGAMTTRI